MIDVLYRDARFMDKVSKHIYAESVLHAKLLKLALRMREFEALALSIDHLDSEAWGYARSKSGRELDGGMLWNNIDQLNGRIGALLALTW